MGTFRVNVLGVLVVALAVGGLSMAITDAAAAQESQFSFDARGGITIPVDHELYEPGPSIGGAFTYWAAETFGLRVAGDVEILSGKSASQLTGPEEIPDMDLFHIGGGVVFRAIVPDQTRWLLDFDVLGGVSSVSVTDLPTSFDNPPFPDTELSETYASASGGVTLGYQFSEQIDGFVSGQAHYVPTDVEDFLAWGQFDPNNPSPESFETVWTLPIRAGVSVNF